MNQIISAQRFFADMRFVEVNSKYSLVSHIFEIYSREYLRSYPNVKRKCICTRHSVVLLPSLNSQLLAKCWNIPKYSVFALFFLSVYLLTFKPLKPLKNIISQLSIDFEIKNLTETTGVMQQRDFIQLKKNTAEWLHRYHKKKVFFISFYFPQKIRQNFSESNINF